MGEGKNIQIAKEEGQLSLFAYKMVLYTLPYIKALKILRNVFFLNPLKLLSELSKVARYKFNKENFVLFLHTQH